MGTNDRDKQHGPSLVDGLKRKVKPEKSKSQELQDAIKELSEIDDSGYAFEAPPLPYPSRRPRVGIRTLGMPRPPKPALLGFEWDTQYDGWSAQPTMPFKPKGLFIVGNLPVGARMEQAFIGTNMEVLVSFSGIPAHFFTTAKSYEQIAKMVKDGDDALPAWGEWSVVHPGQRVHIRIVMHSHLHPTIRQGHTFKPGEIDLGMWGLMMQADL